MLPLRSRGRRRKHKPPRAGLAPTRPAGKRPRPAGPAPGSRGAWGPGGPAPPPHLHSARRAPGGGDGGGGGAAGAGAAAAAERWKSWKSKNPHPQMHGGERAWRTASPRVLAWIRYCLLHIRQRLTAKLSAGLDGCDAREKIEGERDTRWRREIQGGEEQTASTPIYALAKQVQGFKQATSMLQINALSTVPPQGATEEHMIPCSS
ncbi:uncharacterized protein [Saccopteryx bilineata]|uniref:uncharacterized protein n=1 Tax=Saccopteryx bilineata TaxID=59482 RepID=UPI00338E749D